MRIFNLIWKRFFKRKERHDFTPDSAFVMKEEENNGGR